MWYLQTDVLLRLFIGCGAMILISGLSRLIFKKDFGPKVLVFASIAVIAYVSWQLAIAIVCYTLITFIFARILKPLKKTRRFFFVLFSILCTVPFFYGRMTEFFPQLPVIITFVGIAYHMLKAVDVMYFVYYTDMDIPFLTYVNYMLFFPTFTAGPIFRYRDFQKVYNKPVPLTTDRFITCVKRFIKGMFKKMVVLYFVSTFFNFLVASEKHWYVSLAIVVFSYLFLFFDLSGYSDMAIGLGRMLGFDFPENFNYPFVSASATEFWRRWHISLSSWFRDYLFYPVLRSRAMNSLSRSLRAHGHKKAARAAITVTALLCVWSATGLWHGASWNYVLWGLYYFVLLTLEMFIQPHLKKHLPRAVSGILAHIYFALITVFGMAIFSSESNVFASLGRLLGIGVCGFSNVFTEAVLREYLYLIIAALLLSLPMIPALRRLIYRRFGTPPAWLRAAAGTLFVIVTVAASSACLVGNTYNPFLYFRF